MRNTRYRLTTSHPVSFKACVVADLHDRPYGEILSILRVERPDLILVPATSWTSHYFNCVILNFSFTNFI